MSSEPTPTLGQRIDAVLEPLYAEAEQYRATLAKVAKQQQAFQELADSATQGLGQIESRMAEVVRAMAQQEPVIAAVVGDASPVVGADTETSTDAAPAEQAPPSPEPEPEAAQVQPEPVEATAEPATEPEPEPEPEPATAPTAEAPAAEPAEEAPAVELDPAADTRLVNEVAALLDAPPAEAEAEPKVDLAVAAERAASAAKLLREQAAAK